MSVVLMVLVVGVENEDRCSATASPGVFTAPRRQLGQSRDNNKLTSNFHSTQSITDTYQATHFSAEETSNPPVKFSLMPWPRGYSSQRHLACRMPLGFFRNGSEKHAMTCRGERAGGGCLLCGLLSGVVHGFGCVHG
ncbi:hypothetical protein CC86DRAFT_26544 [Ophiobolus disseminans]|uniref:Uncharacterized protein n=1 Tax=Ophiobolus disseminans TaxID=1469910 RepID=A0A6A6ZYU9_9PLEO|nr:hypothetical protein CC86DRAFT_26544 [Ophiobolus disseminans]